MARKNSNTTNQAEPRQATFNLEDPTLQVIIAQAVAARLAVEKAEMLAAQSAKPISSGQGPEAANGKSDLSAKNELATIRAFKRAGHGLVVPHVDVFTFNKWVSKGFRPKAGSKAVKVNNLRLFCKIQVREMTKDELKAMKDQRTAATKRGAKVVPINGGEASPQLL
jgi:hypothetical protein